MPQRLIRKPESAQPEHSAKDEVEMLREFIRNHGQTLVIALGVCLAIALGFGAYKNHKQSSAIRASQLLMNARSSEELQQVVSQHPSAPTTPLAMLTLAARYYDDGQYEMARFTYSQFEQKYPKHSLIDVATLGKAQCLESEGQLSEAISAYESLFSSKPDHFLAPLARLSKARALMQMGRFDDARTEYEDFIAANPDSDWATLAESALLFVDKEVRSAAKGGEAPEPVSLFPFAAPTADAFSGLPQATELPPAQEAQDLSLPGEAEPAH